jgi:hypothetical protein
MKRVKIVGFDLIEKHIEKITGLTVEAIRRLSPEKTRQYFEEKNNKRLSFVSEFPVIGRGNVLRDTLVHSDELNNEIDTLLGIQKNDRK